MTAPEGPRGRARFPGLLFRLTAIALLWLFILGLGTACFFPPGIGYSTGTSDDWDAFKNASLFATSMAVAGTVAVVVGFAVAGKARWVWEVLVVVTLTITLFAAVVCTCLWLNPWLARSRMGYPEFVRLQGMAFLLSQDAVRYNLPLGSAVGLVLGAFAGLSAVAARRSPRVGMLLVAGLLVAGAAPPVQRLAFDVILFWGHVLRRLITSYGMTDPLISASGAVSGAIAGSTIAAAAIWPRRKRTSSEGTPPAPVRAIEG